MRDGSWAQLHRADRRIRQRLPGRRSCCDARRYTGGMETATLLLVVLLVAVLAALVLLLALLLRKPDNGLELLLRDEQRAGRGELREQLADSIQQERGITDQAFEARPLRTRTFASNHQTHIGELPAQQHHRIQ